MNLQSTFTYFYFEKTEKVFKIPSFVHSFFLAENTKCYADLVQILKSSAFLVMDLSDATKRFHKVKGFGSPGYDGIA
jgi:hypothetical protein